MKQKSLVIVTLFWVLSSCVKTEVEVDGSLFGSVKDGVSNAPIANCLVSIDSLHLSARTNAEGIYEFERLDMGRYQLRFKATNYQELSDSVVVAFGKKTQKDVLLNKVGVPGVLSAPASEITYNSARINANIIQDGGADINSCGFYWGTSTSDMKKVSSSVGSTFFYNLVSLQENTEYFYKAFAVNSFGEGVGNIVSFVTNTTNKPNVKTQEATDITGVSAILHAEIITVPKEGINSIGFYIGKEKSNLNKEVIVTNTGNISYQYNLEAIDDNTTYYYCAFIQTSDEYFYGDTLSFITQLISLPSVSTNEASYIGETSAILNATFTSGNEPDLLECGFYYAIVGNDIFSNSVKMDVMPDDSSFEYTITDLQPNSHYFFMAYAKNRKGMKLGEKMFFSTSDYNGYSFVDLGLPSGIKWATYNVGANNENEVGSYYAWGEISTKSYYNWYNYIPEIIYGHTGQYGYNATLLLEDDIAHASMGGSWRMPLNSELQELLDACTWTKSQKYFTGKGPNGNTIILPCGGVMSSSVSNPTTAYYWSSNTTSVAAEKAYCLILGNSKSVGGLDRCNGCNVRAVTK